MINTFRKLVKSKLDEIADLKCGKPLPDNMLVENEYYFGYTIIISTISNNLDYSNKSQVINITGHLATKGSTMEKMDKFSDEIIDKLSELRFRCTFTDVTAVGDTSRRYMITGNCYLNSLDNQLR